ncbi:MAG: SpoIID/LytB domain-containing protein [Syntrophales bacterium]
MEEPKIRVGICDRYPEIRGRLNGFYRPNGIALSGEFVVRPQGNAAVFCDEHGREIIKAPELRLFAEKNANFTINEVTIGVGFHWEQQEKQTFPGDLTFLASDDGKITAINELPVETYLQSVVSSEMSGDAPPEFLHAHAIASRSWLVAMLQRKEKAEKIGGCENYGANGEKEVIRWYEREDHDFFDVCADDHCQRYQGTGNRAGGNAAAAVRATRGVFLIYEGQICDARYHKACGGMTEDYRTCWAPKDVPYLSHVCDSARPFPPLRTEQEAADWILSTPDSWCNVKDERLLKKILPAYDRKTADFFRWRVEYKREELEEIIRRKSGIDFGVLQNLVPLQRGPSGRISSLRIEGTKAKVVVGKELEIRRWLSPSHLYSSAFVVESKNGFSGAPSGFVLRGAGWGHGVGLCQIGAAAMASRGFTAEEILRHYFRGAALVKRY